MARDQGSLVWRSGVPLCVVLQRYSSAPRFRLWALRGTASDLLEIAGEYGARSARPVTINNIDHETAEELLYLHPRGSLKVSEEILVSTEDIARSPDRFFNSRALTSLRRDRREMVYSLVDPGSPEVDSVISTWKSFLGHRHFRLSIVRDYVSNRWPYGYHYLGMRGGVPVCTQIIFPHPGAPGHGVQAVEKSLNYSQMPGGRPGTSDANLLLVCEDLASRGIQYLNLGTYDGGAPGLGARKRRFVHEVIHSYVFTTAYGGKHEDRD
jgi:hypothetical protein